MAEHTTAAHTSRLTEFRRLDSADKARRVLAALDATISAGETLHASQPWPGGPE